MKLCPSAKWMMADRQRLKQDSCDAGEKRDGDNGGRLRVGRVWIIRECEI